VLLESLEFAPSQVTRKQRVPPSQHLMIIPALRSNARPVRVTLHHAACRTVFTKLTTKLSDAALFSSFRQ
jgi:hypothetical protein